ncbi:hypothetical protein GCM10009739_26790 [Microbacterium ulmi]
MSEYCADELLEVVISQAFVEVAMLALGHCGLLCLAPATSASIQPGATDKTAEARTINARRRVSDKLSGRPSLLAERAYLDEPGE